MSEDSSFFLMRDGVDKDKNFILATFLRGLYYGEYWYEEIPKDIFMNNYKHIAKVLIDAPGTTIKVACDPEEPSVIYGYSIMNSDYSILHWVYVKKVWRSKGIGRALVPQRLISVTHLSKLGKLFLSTKYKDTIFNPFKLF